LSREDVASLNEITAKVRGYSGLTRKAELGIISSLLPHENTPDILASRGEDGAVIDIEGNRLILAADGIMEDMISASPRWAGYCSILVNINDILAMRAKPLFAVNVISAVNEKILCEIRDGMVDACERFRVGVVGGHVHPDASVDSISVAMIGRCESGGPLLSSTARKSEKVLIISDLDGRFTPNIPYSWDCTSSKSSEELSLKIDALLSAFSHMSSAKDISNSGMLGTLAMLLEASLAGAVISVGDIPVPEGIDLIQWILAYQGMGFIGTASEENIKVISEILSETGLTVASIGEITDNRLFKIRSADEEKVLFDLYKEKITGLF